MAIIRTIVDGGKSMLEMIMQYEKVKIKIVELVDEIEYRGM